MAVAALDGELWSLRGQGRIDGPCVDVWMHVRGHLGPLQTCNRPAGTVLIRFFCEARSYVPKASGHHTFGTVHAPGYWASAPWSIFAWQALRTSCVFHKLLLTEIILS